MELSSEMMIEEHNARMADEEYTAAYDAAMGKTRRAKIIISSANLNSKNLKISSTTTGFLPTVTKKSPNWLRF